MEKCRCVQFHKKGETFVVFTKDLESKNDTWKEAGYNLEGDNQIMLPYNFPFERVMRIKIAPKYIESTGEWR